MSTIHNRSQKSPILCTHPPIFSIIAHGIDVTFKLGSVEMYYHGRKSQRYIVLRAQFYAATHPPTHLLTAHGIDVTFVWGSVDIYDLL